MSKVNSLQMIQCHYEQLVLMLEENIENRGPFIKQPQNSEPMNSAKQWLMSPSLDSHLKIHSLKHIGVGEGKNGSTEPNRAQK